MWHGGDLEVYCVGLSLCCDDRIIDVGESSGVAEKCALLGTSSMLSLVLLPSCLPRRVPPLTAKPTGLPSEKMTMNGVILKAYGETVMKVIDVQRGVRRS